MRWPSICLVIAGIALTWTDYFGFGVGLQIVGMILVAIVDDAEVPSDCPRGCSCRGPHLT